VASSRSSPRPVAQQVLCCLHTEDARADHGDIEDPVAGGCIRHRWGA
jgi:hypothetical protein